jgi:hypothetical protein
VKKFIQATVALALCATVGITCYAAVTIDLLTGEGFVGKGDVQLAFNWNNKQLQDNADGVSFSVESTVATEVSWTCTNTNWKFNGIFSPKETPILAIAYVDDPWRKGKSNEGRCANQASGRDIVQVDLEGTEHATFQNKLAQSAVAEFLKKHLIK